MSTINNNLMAANVANNLNAQYGRLVTSVQRLSSGLRINSAADDAAGLAIRELMRADVAALNQGARNANDAISMLQVADGALAIIDEKLIRMKELAEQAATGTYNSTQRLIIDSEYKAMADEIDRIARATDFNGIKLLDGSLSGAHNGKGLQSTGMMKIHFGSANDSAEDYYYVSIGACTSYALGLGGAGSPGGNQEVVSVIHKTFKPQTSYVEYVDPDTGNKYYSDGDFYFSNTNNPAGTALDWETDGQVIERLKTVQRTDISNVTYDVYVDPVTNIQYYKSHVGGSPYLLDPFNPQGGRLDSNRDKEIIDRLQDTRNGFGITLNWDVYLDPAGKRYYSCDNGKTFVPNTSRPSENVLDSRNPADNEIIKAFTPEMVIKYVTAPSVYIDYLDYVTPDPARPGNYKKYYSSDGGKTFVVDPNRPDLKLDPNDPYDKRLIDGMKPDYQTRNYTYEYEEYRDKTTGTIYYKSKQNNTYTLDKAKPDQIALDGNNPAHAAAIANLEPQTTPTSGAYKCDIYRDASSGKMYYTRDNGQTFFSDLRDMNGSVLDASHPDYYAGILNNMEEANGTAHVDVPAYRYNHPQLGTYYSADGGKTFVRWAGLTDLGNPELDINNPQDAAIINNMALSPDAANYRIEYDYYIDPVTGASYYQDVNGNGDTFCRDMSKPDVVALDRNNPADQAVLIVWFSGRKRPPAGWRRNFRRAI